MPDLSIVDAILIIALWFTLAVCAERLWRHTGQPLVDRVRGWWRFVRSPDVIEERWPR